MNPNQEELNRIFKTLPENLKDAVTSIENFRRVQNIGSEYRLSSQHTDNLYNEVTLILFGLKKLSDLKSNIVLATNLNDAQASLIEATLINAIFNPVKSTLESASLINSTPTSQQTTPTAQKEETKPPLGVPNYSNYESGKDPYREPLS